EDELGVRRAQQGALGDEAAVREVTTEGKGARRGDDRLVEIEEGRYGAGHVPIVGRRLRVAGQNHRSRPVVKATALHRGSASGWRSVGCRGQECDGHWQRGVAVVSATAVRAWRSQSAAGASAIIAATGPRREQSRSTPAASSCASVV